LSHKDLRNTTVLDCRTKPLVLALKHLCDPSTTESSSESVDSSDRKTFQHPKESTADVRSQQHGRDDRFTPAVAAIYRATKYGTTCITCHEDSQEYRRHPNHQFLEISLGTASKLITSPFHGPRTAFASSNFSAPTTQEPWWCKKSGSPDTRSQDDSQNRQHKLIPTPASNRDRTWRQLAS
jgi:hypothetical protein